MEKSFFFNSVNHDRRYKAADWAAYFAMFIGNGIFPKPSTNLQVVADGTRFVLVQPGPSFINGYGYVNTAPLPIDVETGHGQLKRIARIVNRWSQSDRKIHTVAKFSAPAASPTPPALQRDADGYELCLADILIGAGATGVTQSAVTDRRFDANLCGIVHALVDQIDMSVLTAQFDAFFAEYYASVLSRYEDYNSGIGGLLDSAGTRYHEFIDTLDEYQTGAGDDFLAWFDQIKGLLDGDAAANLASGLIDIGLRVTAVENRLVDMPNFYTASWLGDAYLGAAYMGKEV